MLNPAFSEQLLIFQIHISAYFYKCGSLSKPPVVCRASVLCHLNLVLLLTWLPTENSDSGSQSKSPSSFYITLVDFIACVDSLLQFHFLSTFATQSHGHTHHPELLPSKIINPGVDVKLFTLLHVHVSFPISQSSVSLTLSFDYSGWHPSIINFFSSVILTILSPVLLIPFPSLPYFEIAKQTPTILDFTFFCAYPQDSLGQQQNRLKPL